MFVCPVYHSEESRQERVNEAFLVEGQYVLVRGSPATVCVRCGEMSFSAETVERVRLKTRSDSAPSGFISTKVFDFASCQMAPAFPR